jgi:hypothetical protein
MSRRRSWNICRDTGDLGPSVRVDISRMDVSGPQSAPLQIVELVDYEERVIAGAPEMAVVGAPFTVRRRSESMSSTMTRG